MCYYTLHVATNLKCILLKMVVQDLSVTFKVSWRCCEDCERVSINRWCQTGCKVSGNFVTTLLCSHKSVCVFYGYTDSSRNWVMSPQHCNSWCCLSVKRKLFRWQRYTFICVYETVWKCAYMDYYGLSHHFLIIMCIYKEYSYCACMARATTTWISMLKWLEAMPV